MATVAVSELGGLKGYLATHRTLETYPVGAHRWAMLMLTVLATIVSFYEFQFAPLLPLWIPTLHFSLENFTVFLLFAVLLSGGSAMIGGPLADRHGRIIVIDVCLAIIIVLTFANLLMTGFWSFVIIRGAMNLTAGLMWGALGGLTRDMSPRVSRGAAFGLLTVGAVGCIFLWNFISGETLPIFGTWQSQIWIMGLLSIVMYIPVLLWLKDLHPNLRLTIVESETTAATSTAEHLREVPMEVPASGAAAFRELLSRWEVWVLVVGAVAFLTLPITSQTFFPVMFNRAFLVGWNVLQSIAAVPTRRGDVPAWRAGRVRLHPVVRAIFGTARGHLARTAGQRMVVLPVDLSRLDSYLGSAGRLCFEPLRMGRLDVGRRGGDGDAYSRDARDTRWLGPGQGR
jgi:OPA family glycerol-3-phosphate transporter-like MFS transporter